MWNLKLLKYLRLVVFIPLILVYTSITGCTENGPTDYIVAVSHLNVREGPGTEFPIITTVKWGMSITGLNEEGLWIYGFIPAKQTAGWTHSSYLEKVIE